VYSVAIMADSQQGPGLLANILAVAGFIILIVIIVWGAYHLLRLTGSGVSSLFSRFGNNDAITVTVPNSVTSGKSFPISWKYTPKENGTYAFLYQCKPGFRIEASTAGGSSSAVPCGNAYTVGANTNMTVTSFLSGTSTTEVPVSVVFMPSATSSAERPQGTATLKVAAAPAAQPSTPTNNGSTSNTNTPSTPVKPVVTGPADLSVRVLAVGVVDNYGNFVARQPMNPQEITAIKFDIANNGHTSTGTWYFSVVLPTNPAYTYQSPAQMSLAPGAHIENTLRFGPMNAGGGTAYISVDASNIVKESNESNNSASQWMGAPVWNGYQYPAPYVY
jgi:hypothetical protein